METTETIEVKHFLYKLKDGKPIIDSFVLFNYLVQIGYRAIETSTLNVELVRIKDNILYRETIATICQHILAIINEFETEHKCLGLYSSLFITKQNHYFNSSQIKLLPTLTSKMLRELILRDTKDACYIPFLNGIVKISKGNIRIIPLSKIQGTNKLMHEHSIINREIILDEENKEGDFSKFVKNAVREDGYPYMKRALGYLIHNYKDPAFAKIIALVDAHDKGSEYSNGGTGKSLIATEAIRQIRKIIVADGKQFLKDDKFKFQGITDDVSVYALEDIRRDMDMTMLFNACTGEFQVRDLHKANVRIPFDRSPKIVLTANHGLLLRGSSEQRRVISIGFFDYYNKTHTPIDDFGKTFFSHEWEDEDWNAFYNFMFSCVQEYLNEGVSSYANKELGEKSMRQHYGNSLYNAIMMCEEDFKYKHTTTIVEQKFDAEFRTAGLTGRHKYKAIKDILEQRGWTHKQGRYSTFTHWAKPNAEDKYERLKGAIKTPRAMNYFVRE